MMTTRHQLVAAGTRIEQMSKRIETLTKALEPFDGWTDEELEGAPDDMPLGDALYEASQPTVGDLRRVRAALRPVWP